MYQGILYVARLSVSLKSIFPVKMSDILWPVDCEETVTGVCDRQPAWLTHFQLPLVSTSLLFTGELGSLLFCGIVHSSEQS